MKRAPLPLCALLAAMALLPAACSRADIDNKEAVRAAMVEYLEANQKSTGLDVSQIDIGIDAVVFERDRARATVSYTPKSGGASSQWNYTLERQGGKWGNVKRDASVGPHGIPEPETPAGSSREPLPAGHPPVPGQNK